MRIFFLLTLVTIALRNGGYADAEKTLFVPAAREGNLEIVARQITEGIDIDAEGPQGGTALFWAAQNNHLEIVRLLLEHGADVNEIPQPNPCTGMVSMTPLMAASAHGHTDVVKLLLAHGADASAQVGNTALYEHGVTALFLATVKGHTTVVALLTQAATSGERTWKYTVIAIWSLLAVIIMVQPAGLRSRSKGVKRRTMPTVKDR
jgi:ankyrin repeat protein